MGKSAITCTIARKLYDRGQLGASFFFTRGGEKVAHAGMFSTNIAKQLALLQPAVLKAGICKAIADKPDIINKGRQDQWNELIHLPPSLLDSVSTPWSTVLVIERFV